MMRPFAAFLLLSCAACGGEEASAPVGDPAAPEAPSAEAEEVPPEGTVGFDVRLARMYPERYAGSEQICDVFLAGRVEWVSVPTDYPLPVAQRMRVQCRAPTGIGIGDLVFPPAATSQSGFVDAGKRIKVAVQGAPGAEGHPILGFVALVEGVTVPTDDPDVAVDPMAGYDFGAAAGDPGAVGQRRACAVAWVGQPEPLLDDAHRPAAYPSWATHRVDVSCRHPRGEAWVDLVEGEDTATSVLSLSRGDRVDLRVVRATGGRADLPVVTSRR